MSPDAVSLITQDEPKQFLLEHGANIVNHLLVDSDLVFGGSSPRLATVYARYADKMPDVVNKLIIVHLTLYTSQGNLKITPTIPDEPPSVTLGKTAEELFSLYPFWSVYELIYFIHRLKDGFYDPSKWNFNHSDFMKSALQFNKERIIETAELHERREKAEKAAQSAKHAEDVISTNKLFESRSQAMYGRSYHDLDSSQQYEIRKSTYGES